MLNDHNRLVEQAGVGYITWLAAQHGLLLRNIHEHDKGIDAELELTQSLGELPNIISIQIKARTRFHETSKNKLTIQVTEQNLKYWRNYGRPVILMVYTQSADIPNVCWRRVDNVTSTSIKVNTKNQFNKDTVLEFTQIITQYYTKFALNMKVTTVNRVLDDLGDTVGDLISNVKNNLIEAERLIKEYKFNEAKTKYQALASINVNSCLFWYNWGILSIRDDDDTIHKILHHMFQQFPNRFESYELLGHYYAHKENYEEARKSYEQALTIEPRSTSIYNSLGLLYYHQGLFVDAIDMFTNAISMAGENQAENYYFNLALCLTAIGEYQTALDCYDICIKLNPYIYDAYNNKGLLLKDCWLIWDALECFDEAIKLDSNNMYALFNSAYLLKDLGYNERALQRFFKALEVNSDNMHCYYNIALILCREKDYVKSSFYFQKSLPFLIQGKKHVQGPIGIIDMGYEVCYFITVDVSFGKVQGVSCKKGSGAKIK